MHRHDADFITALIQLPLDFRRYCFQRFQKCLQARQTGFFGCDCVVLELIDNIARLMAKTCKKLTARAAASKNIRIKLEDWYSIGTVAPLLKTRGNRSQQ